MPEVAEVVSQTKLLAATVALLKLVVLRPVLVLVTVMPLVTTSVPVADVSVPWRMEKVTDGVVPLTVERI